MQEKETISLEVENLLNKVAVEQVCLLLSNIIIVKKKDGGNRPVINLKVSNRYIIFLHFKKESLLSLKTVLQKNEYMCKLDLNDAYLCVPLSRNNRKRVKEPCSSFYACYVFTKLLKIPMPLLRRIGIHIVIYLDDMLIIGRTREETIALRDTVILLLPRLGFVINQGMIVSSKEITISLPQKKLQSIKQMC